MAESPDMAEWPDFHEFMRNIQGSLRDALSESSESSESDMSPKPPKSPPPMESLEDALSRLALKQSEICGSDKPTAQRQHIDFKAEQEIPDGFKIGFLEGEMDSSLVTNEMRFGMIGALSRAPIMLTGGVTWLVAKSAVVRRTVEGIHRVGITNVTSMQANALWQWSEGEYRSWETREGYHCNKGCAGIAIDGPTGSGKSLLMQLMAIDTSTIAKEAATYREVELLKAIHTFTLADYEVTDREVPPDEEEIAAWLHYVGRIDQDIARPTVVIMLPDKEMAEQHFEALRILIEANEIKNLTVAMQAGDTTETLDVGCRRPVDILIITPDRLESIIDNPRSSVLLDQVAAFMVDDADKLLPPKEADLARITEARERGMAGTHRDAIRACKIWEHMLDLKERREKDGDKLKLRFAIAAHSESPEQTAAFHRRLLDFDRASLTRGMVTITHPATRAEATEDGESGA